MNKPAGCRLYIEGHEAINDMTTFTMVRQQRQTPAVTWALHALGARGAAAVAAIDAVNRAGAGALITLMLVETVYPDDTSAEGFEYAHTAEMVAHNFELFTDGTVSGYFEGAAAPIVVRTAIVRACTRPHPVAA